MIEEDDYLALSGIQHFCFCPRQWGIIHIEQQWEDNTRTFGGTLMHEKADNPFFTESRGTTIVSRSMALISHQLKLSGIADVVEFRKASKGEDGISLKGRRGKWYIVPIEYKYGQQKENNSDLVQLCAQAICLEEMFELPIQQGEIYYGKTKHRIKVTFDQKLRDEVKRLVEEMYAYYEKQETPLGKLEAKCTNCSLENICLPIINEKHAKVQRYINQAIQSEKE